MDKTVSMRDAFFMQLYDIAKEDRNLMVLSGDMGAPALDKFRRDFGKRFINVGIAEHNLIAVAAGLTKEGKNVYTYAIAPFISSRCYEFAKVDASLMQLPIKFVGVGAGFGYDDSGPTHHTTEDISIMRALPGFQVLSPADSITAGKIARYSYESEKPCYIRLERQLMPQIHDETQDVKKGFEELKQGKETAIVSTGNMVHHALNVANTQNGIGVIDLYRIKPLSGEFVDALSRYRRIVSLEEHLLDGGLGSVIAETICDQGLPIQLKRLGIDDRYSYQYGRDALHKVLGIDEESVRRAIQSF